MKSIIVLALAIVLTACGGGGYDSLEDAIDGENCEVQSHSNVVVMTTDEVHCEDGTMITWHRNEADRNGYAQFLEGFLGAEPDEKGTNYLIYRF